jgi:hypothetical protein
MSPHQQRESNPDRTRCPGAACDQLRRAHASHGFAFADEPYQPAVQEK